MLLVLQWLDEGASDDGAVALSATTAARDLGVGAERRGLLAVMDALAQLEDRRVIEVGWPGGPGREARVVLSPTVRRDARRLFGRA